MSVAGVGAFQVVAMASTLLRSKIVAVSLGPAGVGAIALLDQIVILGSQICVLGMTSASTKFLAAAHSDGEEPFAHAYTTFLRIVILLSVVGVAGTALFLQLSVPAVDLMGFAAVVALAILPLNGIPTIQNAMAASQRVRAAATYGLATTVVLSLVSAGATAWDGLRGYYIGTLGALLAVFAGGAWYMRRVRTGSSWLQNPLADLTRYRTAAGSAAVMYMSSLSAPVADLIPRYVITQTQTLEATGLLQAAFGIALAVRNVVRPSFALFLTPTLNRRTPPAQKLRDAAAFTRVMLTLTTIMALLIVLYPSFWLATLYTSKFVAVAPWVFLFLFAITVQQIGAVYVALLFALEELRLFVLIAVGGDILTCVVTALMVPTFGIPAVAIGLLADGVVLCVASEWLLRRRHRLNLTRAAGPLTIVTLASILGLGAAVPTGPVTLVGALIRGALWVVISLALLAWLQRTPASAPESNPGPAV